MYVSRVSDSYVKPEYDSYAKNIQLEALNIVPKNDEGIKDVF